MAQTSPGQLYQQDEPLVGPRAHPNIGGVNPQEDTLEDA